MRGTGLARKRWLNANIKLNNLAAKLEKIILVVSKSN